MKKIGFIYFDSKHIVPHFIGIVSTLYHHFKNEVEVEIITPEISLDYLYELLEKEAIPKNLVKKLPTYFYKKIAYTLQGRKSPSHRPVFKKNFNYFKSFDVLAFNVFNHVHLKELKKEGVKFTFLMHGAGDSHYPFTSNYKETLDLFDLITTPGQKINDLFHQMGNFPYTRFQICGYPKLDIVDLKNKLKFFKNQNPVVIYNPHFRKDFSSFYDWGLDILDFFYQNKNYNLIFAPHMNLFNPNIEEALNPKNIPEKYFSQPNILIDLGSKNSVDMTYMKAADLYLGDISSQIYEFLLTSFKPAIFLNPYKVDWKNDLFFNHWNLGKVVNDLTILPEVLKSNKGWKDEYTNKQKEAIEYTFDIQKDKKSSLRAAEALIELAKQ